MPVYLFLFLNVFCLPSVGVEVYCHVTFDHTVGRFWATDDRPVAESSTCHKTQQTNIRAPDGISVCILLYSVCTSSVLMSLS